MRLYNAAYFAETYGNGNPRSLKVYADGSRRMNCTAHKGDGCNCIVRDKVSRDGNPYVHFYCPKGCSYEAIRASLPEFSESEQRKKPASADRQSHPYKVKANDAMSTPAPAETIKAKEQFVEMKSKRPTDEQLQDYHLQGYGLKLDTLMELGVWFDFESFGEERGRHWAASYPLVQANGKRLHKARSLNRYPKDDGTTKRLNIHIPGGLGFFPERALAMDGPCVIGPGEEKAAAFYQCGIRALSPSNGENVLSKELLPMLKARVAEPIVGYDGDMPGRKAGYKTVIQLYDEGYESVRLADPGDGKDWNDVLKEQGEDALRAIIQAAPVITREEAQRALDNLEWPDPLPLEPDMYLESTAGDSLNEFPVAAFDLVPWLRDFCGEVATQFNMPFQCTAMFSLGMISATLMSRVKIQLKPDWQIHPNLWIMIIFPPSSGKSDVLRMIVQPARDWEADVAKRSLYQCMQAANLEKALLKKKAALESKCGSPNADTDFMAEEMTKVDLELQELPPKNPRRLIYEDFTEEALISAFSEKQNRECGLIISSEASRLYDVLGGLHSGGKGSCAFILKTYDGEAHITHRKGSGKQQIDCPLATILQCVQPKPFNTVINNDLFGGRGLISRFNLMQGKVPFSRYVLDPPPIDEVVKLRYNEVIRRLLENQCENITLRLEQTAWDYLQAWRKEYMPRLDSDTGDLGEEDSMAEWGGKHAARIAKMAACLHVAQHPEDFATRNIDRESVAAAAAIGDFISCEANKVIGNMRDLPALSNAKHILKHMQRLQRNGVVKHQEIWSHTKKRMNDKAEVFDEAMAYLEDRNYIREEKVRKPGAKRPARIYHVNPKALTDE